MDILAVIPFAKVPFWHLGVDRRRLKLLKTLRALRLLKLFKALKLVFRSADYFETLHSARGLSSPCTGAMVLLVWVHLHACLWAASKPDWHESADTGIAIQRYTAFFHDMYLCFLSGQKLHDGAIGMKIFEMLIVTERALIGVSFVSWAVLKVACLFMGAIDFISIKILYSMIPLHRSEASGRTKFAQNHEDLKMRSKIFGCV